jgi:hypothetical protein
MHHKEKAMGLLKFIFIASGSGHSQVKPGVFDNKKAWPEVILL